MEQYVHDHPVQYWHSHVRLGGGPVCEGVAPDVQSYTKMGVEQIHDSPHQRRSLIFPCVRPPVLFLFLLNGELTQQHVIISSLLYSIYNMLGLLGILPQGWVTWMLGVAADVPVYILTPRFVINIRELYVLDMQGRCDCDIDTGFGLSSGAGHSVGVGGTATIRTIASQEEDRIERVDDEVIPTAGERSTSGGDRQESDV